MKLQAPFLVLWTLAVGASVAAFVLHLALRGRTMQLGYELGRARAEQGRLREVERALEVEQASYQTPQRVDVVARTLLGMSAPMADRIVPLAAPAVAPPPPVAPAPTSADAGPAPIEPPVATRGR